MERKFLVLLTLLFSINALIQAQNYPDFVNQPVFYKSDGNLQNLEKQYAEVKAKAKAMGYGGVSTYIILESANSDVVASNNSPEFLIKVNEGEDPETIFILTTCEVRKDTRQIEIGRLSGFRTDKKDVNYIRLNVEKVANNIYKMTPKKELLVGEYAFVNTSQGNMMTGGANTYVFLFSVK